jgi:hypothetical protein
VLLSSARIARSTRSTRALPDAGQVADEGQTQADREWKLNLRGQRQVSQLVGLEELMYAFKLLAKDGAEGDRAGIMTAPRLRRPADLRYTPPKGERSVAVR